MTDTREYRIVHPITRVEERRFRVHRDGTDDDVLAEFLVDGEWVAPSPSVQTELLISTLDGSDDTERV